MTPMLQKARTSHGFALPTVLIASVIMMIVLVAAASATSGIRASMDSQYYNQLAREAAESGVARANDCLRANGYVPQWTTNSLYPNTGCSGGSACTNADSCFVFKQGNVRSTFTVAPPVNENVSQTVKVTGKVELLRSSGGQVWRTYTTTTSARVGIDLSLSTVMFGYIGDEGAYFMTIAQDGTLRAVGNNRYGQLGSGTFDDASTPVTFKLPEGLRPVSVFTNFVSAGRDVFAIATDGAVYGAGSNADGQLGDGTTTWSATPVKFKLPAGKQGRSVGILGYATFVITTDNNIYAAGFCSDGVLGTSYTISGCSNVTTPARVALPTVNNNDPHTLPTDNMVMDYHSAYVRMQSGRVYGWGYNGHGNLGVGSTTHSSTPVKIGTFGDTGQPKATQVATDGNSVWIVDDSGKAWAAGYNYYGQLGDGTTTSSSSLVEFKLPVSDRITKVATDQWTTLALTEAGEVWGVGNNMDGQLGAGFTSQRQSTPVKFILPSGVKAVDVYNAAYGPATGSSYNNTYVIGSDGKVYGAGSNNFGQLGDGTTTKRSTPVAMQVINGTTIQAKQIQAGYGTAVILTANQKIYTVGNNSHGQLGDGTTANSSVPKANRYTNVLPVISY